MALPLCHNQIKMAEASGGMLVRAEIVKLYKKANYCYGAPFVFIVLQLLLNAISNLDFQPFLMLFALTIFPLSITGLVFTKRGFALASSSGDREKSNVGYANFLLGGVLLALGISGFALAYMMTS